MSIAGPPSPGTPVPGPILRLAAGSPIRPAWRNELGGLTFAVGDDRYAKWSPPGAPNLDAERGRLVWIAAAAPELPVPRVLGHGKEGDGGWLLTSAVAGTSAVAPRWSADPARAVAAIGHGLRVLHETLPVDGCPFDWSVAARTSRIRRGRHPDAGDWAPEHQGLTPSDALARLAEPPPIDKLVVCHGDACAPNTLVDDVGRWGGHVDFGQLGVADRWADLAVATWSLEWNFGPGWQHLLLDAYGVDEDPDRVAYYRLLWDLSS